MSKKRNLTITSQERVIFKRIVTEVKQHGGSKAEVNYLTSPKADNLWVKIANLIVNENRKIVGVFTIVVNYDLSVRRGIVAGHYDYTNHNINNKNFPIGEGEHGKKKQSFTLYHFDQYMNSDDVIVAMEKDGKSPATLRELLAFGRIQRQLQLHFPIIALFSIWVDSNGNSWVPCLGRYLNERKLGLNGYNSGWDDHCRFLAVKK